MLFWLEGVWLSQVDLIEENSRSFTLNPQVQSFNIHQSRLCVKGLRPKAFNTFDILHFGVLHFTPFFTREYELWQMQPSRHFDSGD